MADYQILNDQGEVVTTIVADEDFVKAHYTHYVRLPDPPPPPPPSNQAQANLRKAAYADEADPIFFMMQRGEATQEEWQAKIAEIKARYPYYYDEQGNLIEAQ
jgi:hypothetical protein